MTTPKLYPWEIERHLDEARRTYDERLTSLLSEYSARRSVQAQMVREVAELAAGRVAEVEAFHTQQAETLAAAHTEQVQRLEDLNRTLRERVQQLERKFDEKRTLSEERDAQGEEVRVRIARSLGGWRVADLEEVAYRLRCGGAVDDTAVQVSEHTATALVPAPDLVPLSRPTLLPEPERPERYPAHPVLEPPATRRVEAPSDVALRLAQGGTIGLFVSVLVVLGLVLAGVIG